MNHQRNLRIMFITAFALSILGFILDLNERVPDIWVNIMDVVMMTFVLFIIIGFLYTIALLIKSGIAQFSKK